MPVEVGAQPRAEDVTEWGARLAGDGVSLFLIVVRDGVYE